MTYFEPFTDECPGCFLSSAAMAIDKIGNVAGSGQGAGGVGFAVLYGADGTREKLPTLGGSWAEAHGLTNDGFVVGTAQRADGTRRGFVYDGAQLTELGTLGAYESVGLESVGTLFKRGKIIDLSARLVESDRAIWQIVMAAGINGNGEIAFIKDGGAA